MLGFFTSIGLWIVKFATGPVIQQLIKSILTDLAKQGEDFLPVALDAVKQAAAQSDLDAKGKFDFALNILKAKFPFTEASVLNTFVEAAYRLFQNTTTT